MLKKELGTFLIVGGLTVVIDYICYQTLLSFLDMPYASSKAIGFICGTLFAYIANKIWTFSHNQTKGRFFPFVILYLCSLAVNVILNNSVIKILGEESFHVELAFLLATACSAAINFVGMKFIVFKKDHPEQLQ